jgi:senataxin
MRSRICSSDLNDSQKDAVLSCLGTRECNHQNSVRLIWGPPGTGKTKTVGFLLFSLLRLKCRTLTCAPTNTAVLEVTQRLLKNVAESPEYDTYGLGDIVLFGNEERMKIGDRHDLLDVFLDNRVSILYDCLVSSSGWKGSLLSMICLLEDPKTQYHLYLSVCDNPLTFGELLQRKTKLLKTCIKNMYTHLPTSFISLEVVKKIIKALDCLEQVFSEKFTKKKKKVFSENLQLTNECLQILRSLPIKFPAPDFKDVWEIKKFCLENSCLTFCTVSSSAKLHEVLARWDLLVIDEGSQIKECESIIPLQLPGLRHAVLIGDERQLPAMVKSKV